MKTASLSLSGRRAQNKKERGKKELVTVELNCKKLEYISSSYTCS